MDTIEVITSSGIIIPEGNCYIDLRTENPEGERIGIHGDFSIDAVLFGWEFNGEKHEGYIPYLASKVEGFKQNIESNLIRYQGLINCLTKGLRLGGQRKSSSQIQDNFFEFKAGLEFLYGYLGDMPELLEIKGKKEDNGKTISQNISLKKLLELGERKITDKRTQERGVTYTLKILEVLDNISLPPEAQTYIESTYKKGKTPKLLELKKYGISDVVASQIVEQGDFRKIQTLVSGGEILIGEQDGYRLLEMLSITHLEEESKITDHCVGKSDHYIRRINNGEIRIFSLRKEDSRVTIEYDIKKNRLTQMQGEKMSPRGLQAVIAAGVRRANPEADERAGWSARNITLDELGLALKLIGNTGINKPFLEYSEISGLENDEDFYLYYSSAGELLLEEYVPEDTLKGEQVCGGKIICNRETSLEEIQELGKHLIDIDTTLLQNEIKAKITYIKGSLIDKSNKKVSYPSITYVGGDLTLWHTKSVDFGSIQEIGGNFECADSLGKLSLPSLIKIGGDFDCMNTSSLHIDNLEVIGGTLKNKRIKNSLCLPGLKSIGGLIYIGYQSVNMPSLITISGTCKCTSAKEIEMLNLESVWNIYIDRATHVDLPKLKIIKGILFSHDTDELSLPQLEEIGDHAVISTNVFNAPKLKGPGELYFSNTKTGGDVSGLKNPRTVKIVRGSTMKFPENLQFEITYR